MIKNKDLKRKAPETWCADKGKVCGYYNLRSQFLFALSQYMNEHDLTKNEIIGVSGIGCSGRFTVWQDLVTVHTTHGNAANLAQGAALIKDINNKKGLVYIVSGDGDASAIGRSNFENLCRSNVNVTYLILNNGIYAMTSGQTAPTTKKDVKTISAPYGNLEKPLDIVSLALEAGATFVARTSSYPKESKFLRKTLSDAFEHNGTSIVEVISYCPTQNPENKKLTLSESEKLYLEQSIDIDSIKESVVNVSPHIKYLLLKDYVQNELNENMLIKGNIQKVEEKSYTQLLVEQKKSVKKGSNKSLSANIRDLLKDYKIDN